MKNAEKNKQYLAWGWVLLGVILLLVGLYSVRDLLARQSIRYQTSAFSMNTPIVSCEGGSPQILLSWNAYYGSSSYTVQRETSKSKWVMLATVEATTLEYVDKSVSAASGLLTYRVSARVGRKQVTSASKSVWFGGCSSSSSSSANSQSSSSSMSSSSSSSTSQSSSSSSSKTSSSTSSSTPSSSSSSSSSSTSKSSSSASSSQSSSSSSATTSSSSSSTSSSVTVNTKKWGAYVGDRTTDAAAFESTVGKTMNMQAIFVEASDPFPSNFASTVRDKGKTLVLFWEPYSITLDEIINGDGDSQLQQFAAGAQSYDGPVIFVPLHEMNGEWNPWSGTVGNNTPAKVIEAWRHIHGFFGNATNVKFGWAVNNVSVPTTAENSIEAYYPGSEYVDYVGVDGFNFGSPWQSFDSVFKSSLQKLGTYGKPIYIFSMACAGDSRKADWITDALTVQMAKYPSLAGWIWFNQNKERDWRVNSDAASLEAFKNALP